MRTHMRTGKMSKMTAACLLSCLMTGAVATVVRAELPPTAYQAMKAKAPEVIEIKVTRVKTTSSDTKRMRNISVYAEARVVSVSRSASKLKVGDKIMLRYTTFKALAEGWVGPSPALTVQTGKSYHAWLKKSGSYFSIVARGQSLEKAN